MEHQAHGTGEKKGIMDKIKAKLPGGHGDRQQTAGAHGQQGHTGTGAHVAPASGDTYGQQGHTGTGIHGADTGEKKGVKENIKDKLPGGHGDHQQTGGTYGQQGHTGTGTYDTPAIDDTYGDQGHTGHTGTGIHGADTGEKKGVKENIKDKLPGGHGDHQQTGGTYGLQGHTGTGADVAPATGDTYGQQGHTGTGIHGADTGEKKGVEENIKDKLPGGHSDHQQTGGTYGQQGHTGTGTYDTPAIDDTYGDQGHTGHTGTGIHGADTGEKKGVKENIKDKLPGGHGDHQQTGDTYGQQGHTGTGTYDTPAIDDTYEEQCHKGHTGARIHGADTGEKKGVKENIKDKLPGGHDDHQQTDGTYGQQGHTGTGTYDTPAIDDTYGEQGHNGHTGAGMHGVDTSEKKGIMEDIKEKSPDGHDEHQQVGDTYGQQGHVGTGTHGIPTTSSTYGKQGHTGAGMHGADIGEKKGDMENIKDDLPGGHQQTGGTYEPQEDTEMTGMGTHSTPATDGTYGQQGHAGMTGTGAHGTDEKNGVMGNIKEKLPEGHADHQQTAGTYGQQDHAGMRTHATLAYDETYGQQGHTGMTGTETHDTDEKKGDMKNIKEKLPGGHADHQQTTGTYGQQDHVGTGTHATLTSDDTYGQQGHTGVTGTGTHGTDEKKGAMDNIKEKLPSGHADHQQTAGTYGQQGHVGTGTHGTPATDDTYGQHGHTGVTDTTHITDNTGDKKGAIENIKEKLPGGHDDHQQTTDTYGQHGHNEMTDTKTHGTTATGGTYGQPGHTATTGTGTHGTDGIGEKKSLMDKIKEKLPGQH